MSMPDTSEILKDIKQVIDKRREREEEAKVERPLTYLEEIKEKRTPVGKGKMVIAGVPVDLFAVEDFVIKASGTDVDSLLSFERARFSEMIRNNQRPEDVKKPFEFNFMWILFIIIAAAAGLLIFIFLPRIMEVIGGMF